MGSLIVLSVSDPAKCRSLLLLSLFHPVLTFDLLCAASETLQRDTGIPCESEVVLSGPFSCPYQVLEVSGSCVWQLLTIPSGPSPTRSSESTCSVTTSRLATASIPRMMMAPCLCAFGISCSVPTSRDD